MYLYCCTNKQRKFNYYPIHPISESRGSSMALVKSVLHYESQSTQEFWCACGNFLPNRSSKIYRQLLSRICAPLTKISNGYSIHSHKTKDIHYVHLFLQFFLDIDHHVFEHNQWLGLTHY